MSWKKSSVMDQKIAFIRDYEAGDQYFSDLCQQYGISRKTGYSLVRKWESDREQFFLPKSKRPHTSPNSTSSAIISRIKHWRYGGCGPKSKKKWGARKIRNQLRKIDGLAGVPSETTINNILAREGLMVKKKVRPQKLKPSRPRFETSVSNELWSADYKGYRRLGNGRKCYPLTVCDNFSRKILDIRGGYRESYRDVIRVVRALLREYGQPEYFLTDNGSVFASVQSPCGFGRFSYFLIDHGIRPVFIDPGSPTQNGKHERMHRELERECFKPPAIDLRVQSRRLGEFRRHFNEHRPHEGLDMKTPDAVYESSPRAYEEKVRSYDYPSEMMIRKVYATGSIRWGSYEWVSISRALSGKYIAYKPIGERSYEFYYRSVCLGHFTEGDNIIDGQYYRLISSRDMPEKYRDWDARKRK